VPKRGEIIQTHFLSSIWWVFLCPDLVSEIEDHMEKMSVLKFLLVLMVSGGLWSCSTVTPQQDKKITTYAEPSPFQEKKLVKQNLISPTPLVTASGVFSSEEDEKNKGFDFSIHKARVANHSRLLAIQIAIRNFIQETKGSGTKTLPSLDQIQEWAYSLYEDALLSVALDGNSTEEERQSLLLKVEEGGDEIDLMLLHSSNPYLDDVYLDRLRKVLGASFQTESSLDSTVSSAGLVLEIQDLLKRRKRYSDSYYKTEMKDYFQNDSVPLNDKITYFENFLATGDTSLVKYGAGYFEYLKEEGAVDPQGLLSIDNLLERVDRQ